PGKGQIQLSTGADMPAVYPDGTVFVKHLTLEREAGREPIRLETQLLHYEDGAWRPYSYLWDDAGRDATLVDSIGTSRPLRNASVAAQDGTLDRTWHVNAINECKLCHNAGPKFVLGFTLQQLDRPRAGRESSAENQLSALAAQGVIAPIAAVAADDPARLVNSHD